MKKLIINAAALTLRFYVKNGWTEDKQNFGGVDWYIKLGV